MDVAFANDKLFAVIDGVLYKRVQGDTSYQAAVFPQFISHQPSQTIGAFSPIINPYSQPITNPYHHAVNDAAGSK